MEGAAQLKAEGEEVRRIDALVAERREKLDAIRGEALVAADLPRRRPLAVGRFDQGAPVVLVAQPEQVEHGAPVVGDLLCRGGRAVVGLRGESDVRFRAVGLFRSSSAVASDCPRIRDSQRTRNRLMAPALSCYLSTRHMRPLIRALQDCR